MKKKKTNEIYLEDDDPWNQSNYGGVVKKEIIIFLTNFCNKHLNCKKGLEIGCGLGYYTNLININTNINCLGSDNSTEAIRKASLKFNSSNFLYLDITDKNKLITKLKNIDVLIMLDVSWYILKYLKEFVDILKENFKGKYIIHSLVMYKKQNYGNNIFTNHNELIKFFGLKYIYDGIMNSSGDDNVKYNSYFLAQI